MKPSLGSGELLFVDEVLERRWASVVAIASIWNQFNKTLALGKMYSIGKMNEHITL
jgi:hypothetical protein